MAPKDFLFYDYLSSFSILARPSSAILRRASAEDGIPGAVLYASCIRKFFLKARGGFGSCPLAEELVKGAPKVYEKVTLLAPTELPAGFFIGNLMDFIENIFLELFGSSLAPAIS